MENLHWPQKQGQWLSEVYEADYEARTSPLGRIEHFVPRGSPSCESG